MSDAPKKLPNRSDEIAARLLGIESQAPSSMRMKFNLYMMPAMLEELRKAGHKKPLFTSQEQFLISTILRNESILARFLSSSLLAGPRNEEGLVLCWGGTGRFAGTQGVLRVFDFSGWKQQVLFVLHIEPFFSAIADLLESPTT